jgi:hypothetical protein
MGERVLWLVDSIIFNGLSWVGSVIPFWKLRERVFWLI